MTEPTPPVATLVDVPTFKRWPGVVVDDDQADAAELLLEQVTAFVRVESGDPALWPAVVDCPAAARGVIITVAARVWRNPRFAVTIVDGPFTEQFSQAVEDGLYLTETEKATLSKLISTATGPLFTVSTTRGECDPAALSAGYLDRYSGSYVPGSPYPDSDQLINWPGYPGYGIDCP